MNNEPEHAIVRAVTRLLPESLRNSRDTKIEAIVLLFILMSNTTICLLFLPLLYWGFDLTPLLFEFGINIISACLVTYLVASIVLCQFGQIVIAGNIAQVAVYCSAIYAGWSTGGVYSPMLYMLLIPPVFAFVLTNITSGVIWFILTISAFFGMWFIDEYGYAEPVYLVYNPSDESLLTVIMPITACIMLMVAITIYEINRFKLRKMLAHERTLLAYKATHDPLTSLANREEFNTQMQLAIEGDTVQHLALIYMDLDGFKPINDSLGHHAGDQVLEVISERLRQAVRGSDTIARLGGDEFGIILRGIADESIMTPILEKKLKIISMPIELDDGKMVEVQASIGVAFLGPKDDADSLCRNADEAMYEAKKTKNTWCFFKEHDDMEDTLNRES